MPARPAAARSNVHAVWRESRPPRALTNSAGPAGGQRRAAVVQPLPYGLDRIRTDRDHAAACRLCRKAARSSARYRGRRHQGRRPRRFAPPSRKAIPAAPANASPAGVCSWPGAAAAASSRSTCIHGERLRQPPAQRGWAHRPRLVVGDLAFAMRETVQPPHGDERAGCRRCRQRRMLVVTGRAKPTRKSEIVESSTSASAVTPRAVRYSR